MGTDRGLNADMLSAIKAGVLYFAIVFAAGFLLGVLRVTVLMPRFGELPAVALELPVILLISWNVCRRLVAQFSVPAMASYRAAMGALAFGLLMLAELGLSVLVFGRSWPEYLAHYQTAPGLLGFAGQIIFALMPLGLMRQQRRPST
ncbi:MAG: hypothetical protein Q8L53_05370 [Aestuariivirga sp.]|nr:hypothetical protein [Aestuariivirga sp.]